MTSVHNISPIVADNIENLSRLSDAIMVIPETSILCRGASSSRNEFHQTRRRHIIVDDGAVHYADSNRCSGARVRQSHRERLVLFDGGIADRIDGDRPTGLVGRKVHRAGWQRSAKVCGIGSIKPTSGHRVIHARC